MKKNTNHPTTDKWETLNKEFNLLIDNLSDRDWLDWYKNKEQYKTTRRDNLIKKHV